MKWEQIRFNFDSIRENMWQYLHELEQSGEVDSHRFTELVTHLEQGMHFTHDEAERLARLAISESRLGM